jgi:hypothetical protein
MPRLPGPFGVSKARSICPPLIERGPVGGHPLLVLGWSAAQRSEGHQSLDLRKGETSKSSRLA